LYRQAVGKVNQKKRGKEIPGGGHRTETQMALYQGRKMALYRDGGVTTKKWNPLSKKTSKTGNETVLARPERVDGTRALKVGGSPTAETRMVFKKEKRTLNIAPTSDGQADAGDGALRVT